LNVIIPLLIGTYCIETLFQLFSFVTLPSRWAKWQIMTFHKKMELVVKKSVKVWYCQCLLVCNLWRLVCSQEIAMSLIYCSFRKYLYSAYRRDWNFLGGSVLSGKKFKCWGFIGIFRSGMGMVLIYSGTTYYVQFKENC